MRPQENTPFNYQKTPVSEVISDLERDYDIKFSFDADLILNQEFNFIKTSATLTDVLNAITSQTNLEFEKISKRYYIIKEQKRIDLSVTQELDEILIREHITTGISKGEDGSISISPKNLGILPGLTEPDVLQSLQLLPGVQSPTETASGLFIRGGTPDQNLILWDGIKIYHSGHFFGLISAFNPYITDEVKLFTEGTKARYGNRISGVIDITSSHEITEQLEGGFGFNMTHADMYLKAPVSKTLAFTFSARRSYTDIINTFAFKNLSNRAFQNTKISEGNKTFEDDNVTTTQDFFSFSDFTIKGTYKPSDSDEVNVSSLITNNKLDYGFLIEEFNETSTDELDIDNQGVSFSWEHKYSDAFSHTLQGYYSEFKLNYLGSNNFADEFEDNTQRTNRIKGNGLSFQTDWKLNSNHDVNFGYQLTSNEVDYIFSFSNSIDGSQFRNSDSSLNNTHSVYTEYQYKKQDKWFLNLGLRGNYTRLLDRIYIEPRAFIQAKINNTLQAKLSFEQLHQTISQIIEFNTQDFGLENQIWALAEDDFIPALKSNQVSVGLNFNKKDWDIDLGFYAKKISGLTSLARGFESADSSLFSQGDSDILGIDLLLKKKINDYRTWLSYSFTNNDVTFENRNEGRGFPSSFHIAHQITWSHSYNWKKFDFSLGWNFRTGIPYTQALGIEQNGSGINYGRINGARLSEYHRLDFSSTYKFNLSKDQRWKGKIGVSILNLYNNKSVLNRSYKIRRTQDDNGVITNFLQEVDKIGLGVTPNLIFRVDF